MKRWLAWAGGLLAVLVLLAGVGVAVLHHWANSEDFRTRVEREAGAALAVPVALGRLRVDLWPVPALALHEARLGTRPAVMLGLVELRPEWLALLQGRLQIATLVVQDAVLPQPAIAVLGAAMDRPGAGAEAAKPASPGAAGGAPAALPPEHAAAQPPWPRRVLLERITWVDAKGRRLQFDAQAALAEGGLLEQLRFAVTAGRLAGTRGEIQRDAEGAWPVRIAIGGGEIAGRVRLEPASAGRRLLSGELATRDVEISALTAPSRTLTGRLQARTRLRAEFAEPGGLLGALRTNSSFSVRGAMVHGLDLGAAARGGGGRGGATPLDTLAGQLDTQGTAAQLSQLVANSGVLNATGQVALSREQALSGRVVVALAGSQGAIGVPLNLGGTLDSPSVAVARGALIGAAIGTAIAPGAGTAAGAKLGDRLGQGLRGLLGR